MVFKAPSRLAAEALCKGAMADGVYLYHFEFRGGYLGACHASELPLVFGSYKGQWVMEHFSGYRKDPEGTQQVSKAMASSFASFAINGNPGWEPFTPEKRFVRIFDTECKTTQESDESATKIGMAFLSRAKRPFGVHLRVDNRSRL
jgi:para-nitrobenzyl esterase